MKLLFSLEAIDAGKILGQYLFSKRESGLLVELHNDLTLRYFPRPLPIDDFFARKVAVRLDAHEVPAPCVEDELVLICIHGAKHFWEKWSWIADVAGLLSRQTSLDWERTSSSARAVEAEHLLHTGLRLAVDVLRAKLPDQIAARVQRDVVGGKLAAPVLRWLPAAGYAPPCAWARGTSFWTTLLWARDRARCKSCIRLTKRFMTARLSITLTTTTSKPLPKRVCSAVSVVPGFSRFCSSNPFPASARMTFPFPEPCDFRESWPRQGFWCMRWWISTFTSPRTFGSFS